MEGGCGRSMWQAARCVAPHLCCLPGLVACLLPLATRMMGCAADGLCWLYSWCACCCAPPHSHHCSAPHLQVFWAERKSTPHSRSLFRTRLQVFWAERKSSPDLRILAEQLAADPEAGKAHVLDISMQMVHTAVCPRASAFTVMASHTHTPPTCVPSKPCRCAR